MIIASKPESVRKRLECKREPFLVSESLQFFSEFSHAVTQYRVVIKSVRLLLVTMALAAVSFAGVTITSPANGATVQSPVHVVATATSSNPITFMRIYVDNVSVFGKATNRIDTFLNMATGKHNVVVQSWDSKSIVSKSAVAITVSGAPTPTPTPTASPTPTPPGASGVTVTSPANGATVPSPVHVVASAKSANPITFMRIYVDNVSVFGQATSTIDTLVTMATGKHSVVVQAWDSQNTVFKAPISITVSSNATPTPTPVPPPVNGVTVSSPTNGALLIAPVHVVAAAKSSNPITFMRIYLDSVSVFGSAVSSVDTTINAGTGPHSLVVQAWDSTGAVFKAPLSISVATTTTLSAETSNNTSAADSFVTQSNGNTGAGNVSKVATRSLLYSGSTAKIYAHLMPWFGSSKHMNVGYVSDDVQQVQKQVKDMLSRGLNGTVIDWYGSGKTGQEFLPFDHFTQLVMQQAELNPGFSFAVMYDQGALAPCAGTPGCDLTQQVIDDLNYANVTYWGSPAYQKSSSGRPVLYFFFGSTYNIDWTRVRNGVAGNPVFIFTHAEGFSHAQADGAFAWMKPELSTTSDPATISYLTDFYNTATGLSKPSTGSAFAGFDDSLAPWGQHRKVPQQCGKTWLQTFAEAGNHYSSSNQMSGIQLVSWNDYEEGTEIETGIDNCVTVNASVAGTVVSWTTTGQANTLDHFSVLVSQDGTNLLSLKDMQVGTQSLDVAQFNLNPGNYTVYVKAVGKPSITNKMSAGVALTVPTH